MVLLENITIGKKLKIYSQNILNIHDIAKMKRYNEVPSKRATLQYKTYIYVTVFMF